MSSDPPRHESSPEDLDRIDLVHEIISGHPTEFEEAGAFLDEKYSAESLFARVQRQAELAAEADAKLATGWRPPKDGGLSRLFMSDWVPAEWMDRSRTWWEPELRRWEVLLKNAVDGWLPFTLPSQSWTKPSRLLLVHWITCDPRAEKGPRLSAFQDWPWETGDVFERSTVQCFVPDWPKLNRGVDYALAIAARRGLDGGSKREKSGKGNLRSRPKRKRAPARKGWLYLDEVSTKYDLPPSTAHAYAGKLGSNGKAKDESGLVIVNEKLLQKFLKDSGLL